MARWTTQKGTTMPIIAQESLMECWITCYDMMLRASGLCWGNDKIEQKLASGGFSDAKTCRKAGVGDPDLIQMANALGVGANKTSSINSLAGLKIMLQLGGPLWVAGKFKGSDGVLHKHVVMVTGVDDEGNSVEMVNPWKASFGDTPVKGWCGFLELKESIKSTLNVEGSVQFLTGAHVASLALKSQI
jgi:hypothetical protein